MNYEIREMTAADADAVLEIYQQGIDGGNATFNAEKPSWEQWDADHIPTCRPVLADENGKIIGWAALLPTSTRECFSGVAEVSIYISTSYVNKGLGKFLLKRLISESEAKGFWTLQSGIFPENAASLKIHEKLGFRRVGFREKIAQMPSGAWRDIVIMERRSEKF